MKTAEISCLHLKVRGAVQGVGFRPFVYQLAKDLNLTGWVCNDTSGVEIKIEGRNPYLKRFLKRLKTDKPPHAFFTSLKFEFGKAQGYNGFKIHPSEAGTKSALVLPDYATCSECLAEIFNPQNRRYQYPFTNCTHCGPRFSILESLPYDRPNTTMKGFKLCRECKLEYENPQNRRFHAQPNACPICGPQLQLWDCRGRVLAEGEAALETAAKLLQGGKILGIKGLGGFHLFVDAKNESAIQRLRRRKQRPHKPFALMFPNLDSVKRISNLSPLESETLESPQAPIVLVSGNSEANSLAPSLAPCLNLLGVMLPYTPLHHLLLAKVASPLVATSGNRSEEPICVEESEALKRLTGIADFFLTHNRPIARPIDDSVVRCIGGKITVLRRSRGYAPLPLVQKNSFPGVLAVGGHLKNTVAFTLGEKIYLSQHIGDLGTDLARQAFSEVINRFEDFYEKKPTRLVCDLHNDYASTLYAQQRDSKYMKVQHHHAHVVSAMMEHHLKGPVLGLAWDGTGLGDDGNIWGGEFLIATRMEFQRAAHLRPFPLPGGDQAIREPRRSALGIYEEMKCRDSAYPQQAFSERELSLLRQCIKRGLNSPKSTSMGRLFDAVAALLCQRSRQTFEGQAAMELESLASQSHATGSYPFKIIGKSMPFIVDWAPMMKNILEEIRLKVPRPSIARRFHFTLAEMALALVQKLGIEPVILAGGCFQNKLLTETILEQMTKANIKVYRNQQIPPNDGGLALGQAGIAAAIMKKEDLCV